MTQLVLASASPARLRTLRAAGLDPLVQVSAVDEDALLAGHPVTEPAQVALLLARAKAQDVAAHRPGCLVLGCDSVLDLDGEPLGKPQDREQARSRWAAMSGRSGRLLTGHWLIDTRPGAGPGDAVGEVAATVVHFADVGAAEIEEYLDTGEPFAVAGAFTTDGLGGAFVRGIEGDHHNVVGVSLPLLRDLLGRLGVPWTAVWPRHPDR